MKSYEDNLMSKSMNFHTVIVAVYLALKTRSITTKKKKEEENFSLGNFKKVPRYTFKCFGIQLKSIRVTSLAINYIKLRGFGVTAISNYSQSH